MKTRYLVLAAVCWAFLLPAARAVAPAKPESTPKGSKPVAVAGATPESALNQGMAADLVRRAMGAPDEIKPLQAPEGHAEVWVYQRRVNERTNRVEVGSVPITVSVLGPDGRNHQEVVGQEVQYRNVHIVTEETVELLMFNDHFVVSKISRREVSHFN